jgi:cbb3-type cytochrome oxidase maturation protein
VSALFFLIPVSVVLLGLAMALFWWAVRSRQFDDLEANACRALMEEDAPREPIPHSQHDSSHH